MEIIILFIREFFTPALADGFPLGSDWQQVSSSHQDSSQYSGQSQQCSRFDEIYSFAKFQVPQTLYQSLGDCTVRASYD